MKILLFGKNGQVGWELNRSLQPLGEVIALGREDADFSNPESLRDVVRNINPDVIINAVAYTAVDKAEDEEDIALVINADSPKVLAEEALRIKALLVYYSTDYVFDGKNEQPYLEGDTPCPINAYGRTKHTGEQLIQSSGCDYLIFRTSWVYSSRGRNFLLTILKLAQERDELKVVSDQVGTPTSARLIAETTLVCLQRSMEERNAGKFKSFLYHLTASGYTSWHGFACEILSVSGKTLNLQFKIKNVVAISSDEYPATAQRPKSSRLMTGILQSRFGVVMPAWNEGVSLCLEELIKSK